MSKQENKGLPSVVGLKPGDRIWIETGEGTRGISYGDFVQDIERKIRTDIERAASYTAGKNLTEVYTPRKLGGKIYDQDFSDLKLGDYFDITLKDGEEIRVEISAFNAGMMQGGMGIMNERPHITLTFRDCLKTPAAVNGSDDNTGGYGASELARIVDTRIFSLLPDEWRQIVLPTRRLEQNKGNWAWVTRNMWLLTEPEVFGRSCWGESGFCGGQIQLPIFAGSYRHILKGLGKGAAEKGSRCVWWLGTPAADDGENFCGASNSGHAGSFPASALNGVAPAFNIF